VLLTALYVRKFSSARLLPALLIPALALSGAWTRSHAAQVASASAEADDEESREAAERESRPGEDEETSLVFKALPVPDRALKLADPSVSALAGRILDGTADLRDRRAWYGISLLYSPFESLPPMGWRERALRDGEAISVEARRRRAAQAAASGSPVAPEDGVALASYAWSSLGPTNYQVGGPGDMAQGRATALWVHPTNLNFIFAGFADGGVWKTTNGGTTWTPISDFEVSLSIGSIDVLMRTDTVNLTDAIIYVGLGEGNTASSSVDGAGVLKSVNGGATWTLQTIPWANPDAQVSARFRHSIRRIVIDTNVANAQSVWIAGDGGTYRTVDGGTNWTLVTALPYTAKPVTGGCWPELATDFVIDNTSTPSRLFVAYGARSNSSGIAALSCTGIADDVNFRKNNGIYRSVDGGTNWTSITGAGTGFPAVPGQVGRITLMQAPSNKKQVYALISCVTNGATTCPNGQFSSLGIFRAADTSIPVVAWTAGTTSNFCASQGWYDLTGAVDPTNPAKLFVAGLDVYLSTNSGGAITKKSDWTGTGTGFVHADQHHIVYSNATTVFVACDGGVFKGTITGGTTVSWTNLNAGGLSTLQFYGIGQDPVIAARIHGGLQDNGEAYSATGSTWTMTMGGDGGYSATDQSNGNIAYEEYVYGAIARSTTAGAGGWSCIQNFGGCSGCFGCIPDNQTSFIAPVVLDANAQSTLYTGSKYVYRNTSAPTGSTWSAVSPDLVGTSYDNILYIHSAPNNGVSGTIWATTLNGKVWRTFDNAVNWVDTTASPLPNNPVLPNRAATWITTHPADGRKAIVVYSGWNGSGSQPGHMFRTLDGGATWTDISGAFPDEPVFTITADPARPNDVYIGTEFGVYVNNAAWTGSTWTRINNGQLPHVHVHQLEFSKANGRLRAATHGRGIWELATTCPTYPPPLQAAPSMNGCGVQLSWGSGGAGLTYNVYRASGACPGSGYQPIATGLTGTSYLDSTVSGSLTYSYKVTLAEASGSCESAASACQSIAVPGACPCQLAPAFGGATAVAAPFASTCALDVSWSAGSQTCGALAPLYNVYRSTTSGFTPTPSNRIATCVSGTSFHDAGVLSPGTTYSYVVRAEDGTGTGTGPGRAGNEEANQIRRSGAPQGTLVPGTFFDGAEGAPLMNQGAPLWSQSTTRAHAGTKAYFANGNPVSTCSPLTTPILVLGSAGTPSVLTFWSWRDNLESTFDGGIVEISTDGGGSWTKLTLSPAYPTTFDSGSTSCANTTQTPSRAGFTGNDVAWQGPYTVNLAAFANQTALIRFQFGTDPAVNSTGWYVDDIQVTNVSQPGACSPGAVTVPEVSSIASGLPLLVTKSGANVRLSYQPIAGAGGYNVYEGAVGSWYSHSASVTNVCGAPSTPVASRRETVVTPAAGSRYYLITAYTAAEGPSGFATSGAIPPAASTCPP
jgi:hypothetical protein